MGNAVYESEFFVEALEVLLGKKDRKSMCLILSPAWLESKSDVF